MRFRCRNHGGWTPERSARAHAAKARLRLEAKPSMEPRKVPDGTPLGCLTFTEASGQVRRWHIRQGPRANNIRVLAKGREIVCGWDHFMSGLRKHLSIPKRILE